MSWFDRVKFYYEQGLWSIERVGNVVGKVINEQEYREITGNDYDAYGHIIELTTTPTIGKLIEIKEE